MKKSGSSIEDVVKGVIKDLTTRSGPSEEEVACLWKLAVGEAAAKHSKPVSLKKSLLTVNVDDSGWLYELSTQKKSIIKKLEDKFKGKKFKEIRFRIGEIK